MCNDKTFCMFCNTLVTKMTKMFFFRSTPLTYLHNKQIEEHNRQSRPEDEVLHRCVFVCRRSHTH